MNSVRNLRLVPGAGAEHERNNRSSAWCESEEAAQGHDSEEASPSFYQHQKSSQKRSLWILRLDRRSCP
jgi:hypothetical protein